MPSWHEPQRPPAQARKLDLDLLEELRRRRGVDDESPVDQAEQVAAVARMLSRHTLPDSAYARNPQ